MSDSNGDDFDKYSDIPSSPTRRGYEPPWLEDTTVGDPHSHDDPPQPLEEPVVSQDITMGSPDIPTPELIEPQLQHIASDIQTIKHRKIEKKNSCRPAPLLGPAKKDSPRRDFLLSTTHPAYGVIGMM